MKIVQINANYNSSSIGRTTSELHNWLMEHGEESYVFTTQKGVIDTNVFPVGNDFDHKVHSLCSRLFGLQGYFSFLATQKMLRKLKEIKPNIIHLRNLHANYINLPMLLKYIAENNIGCVITLHDCWLLTGHCCHYVKAGCDKWIVECHNCPMMKYDNNSWFFDTSRKCFRNKKRLFGNVKRMAVLGNSKWTFEQAQQSYLQNSPIIDYVYNWIDRETFYPIKTFDYWGKLKIRDRKFVVLGVCEGWCRAKGLHVFVELARRFPDYTFLLIGSVVEEMGFTNNIISVGTTRNNEELCEYYSHADVLLNPSVQETFGKVSAEALCCGTPIIVNRATANPELVGDGCGYVVDNNDVQQYADYIQEIKKNGKEKYSKKCVKFAAANFDKETNIKANVSIYERLLNI